MGHDQTGATLANVRKLPWRRPTPSCGCGPYKVSAGASAIAANAKLAHRQARMVRKQISELKAGNYWATPHEPFLLDGPNGHDEVFPGAECVCDGKWATFFRDGNEVWSCNATYAAAHFDFTPVQNTSEYSNP